jgi:heptosyltransferase-3
MKAAVICSDGMGDGLLMMIASHRLFSKGYHVTTYTDSLLELKTWFPHHQFQKRPSLLALKEVLTPYDLIILQNDNSDRAFAIIDLYKRGKLKNLSVFYSHYSPSKHPHLTSWDRVFDRSLPMADNISCSIATVLQSKHISKNNGIVPPKELIHRKYKKRILIHPTSTVPHRTWHPHKFLKVAKTLQNQGFEITFCVSPKERKEWIPLIDGKFLLPEFPTLTELASYIYESDFLIGNESGTGHLASNLQLPTLIIASCNKQMDLWRPGWLLGSVVTPPRFTPNLKGCRLRTNKWQHFIPPKRVLSTFYKTQMDLR